MSESDVQFYYMTMISEQAWIHLEKVNTLIITYQEFLKTLERLVVYCLRMPANFKVNFVMDDDEGNARLTFVLDNDMRNVDLLVIDSFR